MNRYIAVAVAVLLAVFMLTACADKEKTRLEKEAIKTIFYNNIEAFQKENVEKCLSLFHPESPIYALMEVKCPKIFEQMDLDHTLVDFKVLNISGDKAKVQTVLETRQLSGPEENRDIRSTTVHSLKKYKGEWKVYQQEQKSIELID